MDKRDKNKLYEAMEWSYSDIENIERIQYSVLSSNSRLSKECMLICFFLEELCGMEKITFNKKITILEPGCGIGYFSRYLGIFSKYLYSFDVSNHAINICNKYSKYQNITFFNGDGTNPNFLAPILGKKFDLIFFREFHPFSRDFFESPKEYVDLLTKYYDSYLKENGIIIIQHSDPVNIVTLNFENIKNEFPCVYGPYHPHLVAILMLILRYKFNLIDRFSYLISRVIWIFSKKKLKYIVIQKK